MISNILIALNLFCLEVFLLYRLAKKRKEKKGEIKNATKSN